MRRAIIIQLIIIISLMVISSAEARRRDSGIPIVSKYVCSNLCSQNETIYIYDGITDPEECKKIGGEMYSHYGWESIVVCKVMNKYRCREYDGRIAEFHYPFKSKNYVHLGCTEKMSSKKCRDFLRKAYETKETSNKYFMNNIGCLVH